MFKLYNEKSCRFECRLRYAANRSACIPWEYPVPKDMEMLPICTSSRNFTGSNDNYHDNHLADFESHMNTVASQSVCHCPPNCEKIDYKTQVGQCYNSKARID